MEGMTDDITDDMMRFLGEIRASLGRMMQDLRDARAERRHAVAHLRSGSATDIAGIRAAWFGPTAAVARRTGVPVPPKTREAEVEHEDLLQEAC